MSNLYYIDGDDDDGYNCSLFVNASTPQEAFDVWKATEMGEFSGPYFEDELTTDKPADAGESDLRIFQVSTHGKSGALPWHNPVGVICVAYAKEAK